MAEGLYIGFSHLLFINLLNGLTFGIAISFIAYFSGLLISFILKLFKSSL